MLTGRSADVLGALRVPLIAAPMTGVSNLELVRAATAAGIVGSFPLHDVGVLVERVEREYSAAVTSTR